MFKKLALATALLAGLSTAHAYQFEINGGYENTDLEESSDLDTFFINGKYYLNGVQVKNAPLAEAAFLAKASNIGLGYVNSNLDVTDVELEIDSVGISGEFFIPNTQFYVSGKLNRSEITIEDDEDSISADNTGYALEVGYLPINGLLLAAGVAKENIDPTLSVGVSVNDATLDEFDTVFSVRAQKFFTPAFAVGVNYTTTDGADSYGINGTFRF